MCDRQIPNEGLKLQYGTPTEGGQAVTLLLEALRYKPEDRGFDSQ
jgi:hypothetical protein